MRGLAKRTGDASRSAARACLVAACLAAAAWCQVPVFRTQTQRVLVSANVVDRNGDLVPDLHAADFVLTVDGRPMPIVTAELIRAAATPPTLGPRFAATNAPNPAPSWVILLLDYRDTTPIEMSELRGSLLRFLRADLQPGQPVAIFGVARKLMLLQPFTADREQLLAAAARWTRPMLMWQDPDLYPLAAPWDSAATKPPSTLQKQRSGPFPPPTPVAGPPARGLAGGSVLDSLRDLGYLFTRVPGRKVAIWLTAHPFFVPPPLDPLHPDLLAGPAAPWSPTDPWRSADVYELLNEAEISLFPVDVTGVALSPDWPSREAMKEAARATGGAALMGDNFTWQLLARAQRRWRSYYLLTFSPPPERNGLIAYHKIALRVRRPGLKVEARRGYITRADPVLRAEDDAASLGAAFLAPISVPGLRMNLRWQAVVPKENGDRLASYRLTIPRSTLSEAELRTGTSLKLVAAVQDLDGIVRRIVVIAVEVPPRMSRSGPPWTLVGGLQAPARGDFLAHFVLQDQRDGRVGSLWSRLPPLPSAP